MFSVRHKAQGGHWRAVCMGAGRRFLQQGTLLYLTGVTVPAEGLALPPPHDSPLPPNYLLPGLQENPKSGWTHLWALWVHTGSGALRVPPTLVLDASLFLVHDPKSGTGGDARAQGGQSSWRRGSSSLQGLDVVGFWLL